jgi:very-short-patch-repair endonuclease
MEPTRKPAGPIPSPLGGERERVRGIRRNRTSRARDFARHLRKKSGEVEMRLWQMLRDRRFTGFKFRRQYAYGPYYLDFFCPEARLAIELDGGVHGFPEQRAKDRQRDAFLTGDGIRVLRFGNYQFRTQPSMIRFEIWRALMEQSGQNGKVAAFQGP